MLKTEKSANRNDHQNRKTDLKNSQNRKTENPNAPLYIALNEAVRHRLQVISSLTLSLKARMYCQY